MGRSVLVTLVIIYQDQLGSHHCAWDTKSYGKPTEANLEKWRKAMNESMKPGGVNEHISQSYKFMPHISKAEIYNQKTYRTVANTRMPMFEAI
jgi:hypothetical protein